MNKKIKIILIIFIILNLIMLGVLTALILLTNEKNEQENNNMLNNVTIQQIDEYHGRIYPKNHSKLIYSYKGNISLEYFYEITYKIVHYLPDLNSIISNYTEDQLQSYYIQNQDQVKENTGLTDFNSFKLLCEKIKGFSKETEYKESTLDMLSYETTEEYDKFKLAIEYKDGNKIDLVVYIANKYRKGYPSVIFNPVEE